MKRWNTATSKDSLNIAIAGGGDAGPVYAGIAIAREIRRQVPAANILFIGPPQGVASEIVTQEGFSFETIDIREAHHRNFGDRLKAFWRVPQAVYFALKILRKFHPAVVLGTGGTVSIPVLYAAYLRHAPTLMLEARRQPSLASRLLSRSVDQIAICFAETRRFFPPKKVILTGHPVRKEFYLIGATPPPDKGHKLNILVMAGNLAAHNLNYALIAALDYLQDARARLSFTHQTGPADFEYVRAGYEKRGFRAEVSQHINDLPKMYAKAHLVICRAGAATMAELTVSGRPAILIPQEDQQQEAEALALQEDGIAKIIAQPQLSGKTLAAEILEILTHPEELAQVWPNTKRFRANDATAQLAAACLQLATGKGVDDFTL